MSEPIYKKDAQACSLKKIKTSHQSQKRKFYFHKMSKTLDHPLSAVYLINFSFSVVKFLLWICMNCCERSRLLHTSRIYLLLFLIFSLAVYNYLVEGCLFCRASGELILPHHDGELTLSAYSLRVRRANTRRQRYVNNDRKYKKRCSTVRTVLKI